MFRWKRFFRLTVGITVVQALMTITSIAVSFSAGMRRFDHPEIPAGVLERVCDFTASVLVQPLDKVLSALNITPRVSILEWTALLLNSLVWGASAALIMCPSMAKPSRSPEP